MAVSETIHSRNKLFGIPVGELGLFQSVMIAIAVGCMAFFASCFVAIISLLLYNELGHHTVDMADTYLYVAIPIGAVALVIALAVMVGMWLRRKISGR